MGRKQLEKMHRLLKVDDTIGFKMGVTFWTIWQKWYPKFCISFFYNRKEFKIIECHVQGKQGIAWVIS
jgi:hypothetical protein